MLPHAAIICLYEPFADVADPNDSATRRLLAGAQGIVSIIQQLASVVNEGAQNFTSVMHSSASVSVASFAQIWVKLIPLLGAWSLLRERVCCSTGSHSISTITLRPSRTAWTLRCAGELHWRG
jgi:hypothetical protein